MATKLGNEHRESPSDHGKPYHEMSAEAQAASHQPMQNHRCVLTPNVARKFDEDKSELAIIDPEFLSGMGRVLAFGEGKYDRMNWAGLHVERLMSAHQRHIMAILAGEDLDPESGERHAHHAACCLMMVDWVIQNREEQDDRRFKKGGG